jgi:hypothetical protein
MGTRTIFVLLLILIALIGFAPVLIGVGSQTVAESYGCQVDLNRVIPCLIDGRDYGPLFYKLGLAIWTPISAFPWPSSCSACGQSPSSSR